MNIQRQLQLPPKHSFFLFGPRQTGKSFLLKSAFPQRTTLYYDLLEICEYLRLQAAPWLFREEVIQAPSHITHVVIDEVQKLPALLDEVHSLIETDKNRHFCMSGSSARKLKRGQANLLAGRAWTYYLFPLTHQELGKHFSLKKALECGTLPSVYLTTNREESNQTLRAYVETYLKEEIEAEALSRDLGGFLRFLHLAADENGNILNYSNIARETSTQYQTVKEYFQILEDTLMGFFLMPYSRKVRKRLVKHPKFYFFDTGVQRAIAKKMALELSPKTAEFGRAFEHFLIAEIKRLAAYKQPDYDFSFYRSSHHAEVDLIVQTPKGDTYAIEIKATDRPNRGSLRGLESFRGICPQAHCFCAALVSRKIVLDDISIFPWQDIFEAIGL